MQDACQGDNALLWLGKEFEDPIPLLTNMDLGEMACEYYRKRFLIETLFKQMKSGGFNLHKSMVQGAVRVRNLILVVALAFIFSFCAGMLLKEQPKETLNEIIRLDKLEKMRPITLIQKCIAKNWKLALDILSDFSKNWDIFFLLSS